MLLAAGHFHEELARRNKVLLYARALRGPEEVVLGYLLYQTNSVVCHIQKLAVDPNRRRRGVAGTLLLVSPPPPPPPTHADTRACTYIQLHVLTSALSS